MLSIPCPWCGHRDETEFAYGGEAHMSRPPHEASDAEWTDYLFMRTNVKGVHRERWHHATGCRRWFVVLRDTTSNRILGIHLPGDSPNEGEA